MPEKKFVFLKIALVLAGIYVIGSGLNIGLGGILTLGWGGSKDFASVTDEHAFLIQDSHVRFVGGVWTGVGLLLALSVTNLAKFKPLLYLAFVLVFLGGLCRLGQGHPEVTFHLPILGSFLAELIGMPLLAYWVSKSV
jgi:hypothetical protein